MMKGLHLVASVTLLYVLCVAIGVNSQYDDIALKPMEPATDLFGVNAFATSQAGSGLPHWKLATEKGGSGNNDNNNSNNNKTMNIIRKIIIWN